MTPQINKVTSSATSSTHTCSVPLPRRQICIDNIPRQESCNLHTSNQAYQHMPQSTPVYHWRNLLDCNNPMPNTAFGQSFCHQSHMSGTYNTQLSLHHPQLHTASSTPENRTSPSSFWFFFFLI